MNNLKYLMLVAFLGAGGCASAVDTEGRFSPACVAMAGDTIELSGGRFVWDKFTDEVTIDAGGNVVDPFPGFPLRGSYRIEDQRVRLASDEGEPIADMYVVKQAGRTYLLRDDEYEVWERDKSIGDCALMLETDGGA